VCNGTPEPTHIPTKVPTAPPSPDPSTNPPTQQFFCGCPECTSTIWNAQACRADLGGCYTCGSRIDYLKGLGQTEVQACTTVSNQFSNGPCGPVCNPSVCNELVLDEPDPNKLTWSDEFNVDGAPDSTKWDYDLGDGCDKGICGWGNNELQVYTASPNNVLVGNGVLRISAKKANGEYTSTRMVSRGKKAFRYGRIRLRARLAGCTAKGTWPALWMLPESWVYGGWPNSGEIDIMEAVGYEENMFHGSVHTSAYNHAIGTQKTGSVSKPEADWHVFEIDWQADKIRFAVDNQVYFVFAPDDISDSTKWPFNQDFHLLLNIAVGGNWGGLNGVDAPAFEDADGQYIEVDWVRAYSS
jgi:beta-glucanase (GH16 family)